MTIRRRIKVPDPQALREEISRCQSLGEIAKVVQHTVGDSSVVRILLTNRR
jgi:hypothetical protein